jgi:hypothetical protein
MCSVWIESIRFMAPAVAVVQARAWHPDPIVLDDGTHTPPFWQINTYTLINTTSGWRVGAEHSQPDRSRHGTAGRALPDA